MPCLVIVADTTGSSGLVSAGSRSIAGIPIVVIFCSAFADGTPTGGVTTFGGSATGGGVPGTGDGFGSGATFGWSAGGTLGVLGRAAPSCGIAGIANLFELPGAAAASPEDLVQAVGPTVQRYLTGDIGSAAHSW